MNLNQILKLIKSARVAHLATTALNLQPYLTPTVFVLDKNNIFIPLDHKPKTVSLRQLKRVKNIQKNPKVAFLVDNYEEDWKRLWFVMIIGYGTLIEQGDEDGTQEILKVHDLLIKKYTQYSKLGVGDKYIKIIALRGFYWSYNKKLQLE